VLSRDSGSNNRLPNDDSGVVGIDGDRVGDRIVSALIANDVEELHWFAQGVAAALLKMRSTLEHKGYELILTTGDGLLARGPIDHALFQRLAEEFQTMTRCTLSIGIGPDLRSTYIALKFAKASGGNCISRFSEGEPCLL